MSQYYDDTAKITFDKADSLVERFVREYKDRRSRITCKDVARAYDVDESHHNLIRLNDALDKKLETARESGGKATQYNL